jgi:hypothetical protein
MKSVESLPRTTFSGRRFTRKQLALVQETVQMFPQLSRKELARTLCELLSWRAPNGRYKIHSCLNMLERLQKQGVLTLPAKRETKAPIRRMPAFAQPPETSPIEGTLESIAPIVLQRVTEQEERESWKAYLQSHHPLGYRQPFGAHLGYFVVSQPSGRKLGCLLFSASAAWALAPRDQWIGWERKQRSRRLPWVLSNDRFLIFPWVKVPNLAGKVLSLAVRQVADDWLREYGYRPVLVETFVDASRYSGTCYRAANWHYLGKTQGRGRLDPRHECKETIKDIYVYPLQADWREQLTGGETARSLKKRYRNDLRSSRRRSVGDQFVALWQQVIDIFQEVAAQYDRKWRLRQRVIDSLLLMLLIFRLVGSKNAQGYGTTIDELWDSCTDLKIPLPQPHSIVPSSLCEARKKLPESIFQCVNRKVLQAYGPTRHDSTWFGHRLFAVDGSKINLPRALRDDGYPLPGENAHYPQGLISCLYHLPSRLPFDFDLVPHGDERSCALQRLRVLEQGDVVVYDRGYFSYVLLHEHCQAGVEAIFRLHPNSGSRIAEFIAGRQIDTVVTIYPSERTQAEIRIKYPDLQVIPRKMRLLKYEIAGKPYCLGTTLSEPQQHYPLQAFMDAYHARWGVEELYKISKGIFHVEDFHAKSERGVKQEVFAQFVLITLNRLFCNNIDSRLNAADRAPLHPAPSDRQNRKIQTSFKNCVHVFVRHLEPLLILQARINTVLQRAYRFMAARYQTVRPDRHYARKSMKPIAKWRDKKAYKRSPKELFAPAP